jgi:DNA polymerase III epsilon subunit-like protein
MNQDIVFVKIEAVDHVPDSIAVARVDRKGTALCSFGECETLGESFENILHRMKREVLDERYSKEYVVVSHYTELERTYLKKSYSPAGRYAGKEIFEGRMWLSTSQLVWPMVDAQMIPSVAFDEVCKYFGIDRAAGQGLNVEKDCTALVRVFFELMRRYKTALLVEEGVRDLGGPTLAGIRSMFGF